MKEDKREQQKPKLDILISIDVESDGPIPFDFSMLSFGSVAINGQTGEILDKFYANLFPLPDAKENRGTMKWWATQPEAWEACHVNQEDPKAAMERYIEWCANLKEKYYARLSTAGWPESFDFAFLHWYLIHFCGYDPTGFSALDIRSLGMGVFNCHRKSVSKRRVKALCRKNGREVPKHTHNALDDALEQAILLVGLLVKAGIIESK